MSDFTKIRELAQAGYEALELPEDLVIDDHEGFEIADNGTDFEMSRKVYYYSEHDGEDECSKIGYFNIRIEGETLDIAGAYFIASEGGVMVGEFTEASRAEAYGTVGLEDPRVKLAQPVAG